MLKSLCSTFSKRSVILLEVKRMLPV